MDLSKIGPPPVVDLEEHKRPVVWPAALLAIAGILCLAAAEFVLTWATKYGEAIVDGRNEPDGVLTLVLAGLALVFLLNAPESDALSVRLAPDILGIATAAVAADAYLLTSAIVGDNNFFNTPAELGLGVYVEVAGGVLVAIAGAIATVAASRLAASRQAERSAPTWSWNDPESEYRVLPDLLTLMGVGAAGVVLGWFTAVWIANLQGDTPHYAARLASLALIGILLGPAITVTAWRRLTRRPPGR
jgi:hypothetical protein